MSWCQGWTQATRAVAVLGAELNSVYRSHVNTGGLPTQAAPAVDEQRWSGSRCGDRLGRPNSVRDSIMTSLNTTI